MKALLILLMLSACTQQCDDACKAQGEARLNEILRQRNTCGV
jgi:hypothetical protein